MVLPHPSKLMSAVRFRYPAPRNLRTLCPNCHSQTETFGSKGQGSRYKKISKRNQYLQSYKNGSLAQR